MHATALATLNGRDGSGMREDSICFFGRFGYDKEWIFPATIGMNKKGGVTDVEFDHFIENSVVPLFLPLEIVPMLASSGKLNQATTHIASR